MHTCTHTHTHNTHAVHTHKHACAYMHTQTCMYVTHTHMHTHTHAHTHTHTACTHAHTHQHVRVHTHTSMHGRTHIHAHTHTHTHTPVTTHPQFKSPCSSTSYTYQSHPPTLPLMPIADVPLSCAQSRQMHSPPAEPTMYCKMSELCWPIVPGHQYKKQSWDEPQGFHTCYNRDTNRKLNFTVMLQCFGVLSYSSNDFMMHT